MYTNEQVQQIEHQLEHYSRVANTIGQDVLAQLEHELGLSTEGPEAMQELIHLMADIGARIAASGTSREASTGTGVTLGLLLGMRLAGKGKLEVAAA